MRRLQSPRESSALHYGLLIVLLLLSGAQQVRHLGFVSQYLRGNVDIVQEPFGVQKGGPCIEWVGDRAAKAGMRKGDRLQGVAGAEYRGPAQLARALQYAKPGSVLTVDVTRDGAGNRTEKLTIPLGKKASQREPWLFTVAITIVRPLFCLLLGFWVVAARPRNPLAWLVLALMLSFSQLVWYGLEDRDGTWLSDAALGYRSVLSNSWTIWFLLFGIYFPSRLDLDRRYPWIKWLLIGPVTPVMLFAAYANVAGNRDYSFDQSTASLVYDKVSGPTNVLVLSSLVLFFVIVGSKYFLEKTPDAKRRLRLFCFGTVLALMPTLILVLVTIAISEDLNALPDWVIFPCLGLMVLFPVTLAYLILVHKAMDVSVVIRQGVQYALARGGVKVVQGGLIAGLILTISYAVSTQRLVLPRIIMLVAVAVFLILQLQRIGIRLAKWVDRSFFRESYDAELLLSDLGEKVRTIVETRPLLETVARRIGETLHVPRVAILLKVEGPFQPAYAIGYGEPVELSFPEAGTAAFLRQRSSPARVYLSDPESWINTTPEVNDDERRQLERLQAEVLLPLQTKEQLLGFISLSQRLSEAPYSSGDLRLLGSVAAQTAMALENAQLTAAIAEEVSRRERLNRELEIAREVQQHLFPQTNPPIETLDYAGSCRPALGVGGDYYDFIKRPGGKLCFAIGDVSGKGISAALLMSNLQAALRSHAVVASEDLASILTRINGLIYQSSSSNRYATFFLAEYEPGARQLTYVNGGHNAPMLFRAGGEIERLTEGGMVVGLMPDVTYRQATVTLRPGDLLVAFTDGISEAMNPADEEWGEERLIQTVRCCSTLESREILNRIMVDADAFAAGAPQHDDMTLLLLRSLPTLL